MKALQLALTVLILTAVHTTAACAASEGSQSVRPKIGLALSGGGARGGAHVGILKALEELDVPVDYIAGTSMGAIIGGLYAAGYGADDIEKILYETDWNKAMSDRPARRDRTMRKKELEAQFLIPYRLGFNNGEFQLPLGAIEGQHLDQLFHRLLHPVVSIKDFSQLPIPFRAVATDLVSGEEVVLSSGSLPDALRASMSVPGVFAPVKIDGRILVDGGMSNNLPVSVVRQMGADIVIAVDISTPLLTAEQLTSVLSVTEQLTNFLTRKNTELQISSLGPQDVLVIPELGDFSSADFAGASKIVELGFAAVMAKRQKMVSLAAGVARDPVQRTRPITPEYLVEFIYINNESPLHDEIIQSRIAVETGEPLDLTALEKSVDRIYSLDVFESVTYDLIKNAENQQGVVIHAVPRDWGPNYLQFGLELSSDFSGNSDFKLGGAYTSNALNSLAGELRVIGSMGREDELSFDFYQPIDLEANWFVEPGAFWRRENVSWWQDDVHLAEFELSGWGLEFGIGRNFSTTDRLRLDYQFARADADLVTGDPGFLSGGEVKIGELEFEYLHDSLNSLWFPTSGTFHRLSYLYAADELGAAVDYQQAIANGSVVLSKGRNTALLSYELGYSFDDAAPIERWFRMGGLGRISGLAPNQLLGRQGMLVSLAYYRRLNNLELIPAFAGVTAEAGNVWDYSSDIGLDDLRYGASVFVGAETPIGPIYFALGHSDNGDGAVYFYVGNPFRIQRFD
jgi:NTE family protein